MAFVYESEIDEVVVSPTQVQNTFERVISERYSSKVESGNSGPMSYFAFGTVAFQDEGPPNEEAIRGVRACANGNGLVVLLNGRGEPGILSTMRAEQGVNQGLAFFCVSRETADTSDELISPHAVGRSGALEGLAAIGRWASEVRKLVGCKELRLLLTEGYDNAFETFRCSSDDLAAELVRRFEHEQEVSSMMATVLPPDAP